MIEPMLLDSLIADGEVFDTLVLADVVVRVGDGDRGSGSARVEVRTSVDANPLISDGESSVVSSAGSSSSCSSGIL